MTRAAYADPSNPLSLEDIVTGTVKYCNVYQIEAFLRANGGWVGAIIYFLLKL